MTTTLQPDGTDYELAQRADTTGAFSQVWEELVDAETAPPMRPARRVCRWVSRRGVVLAEFLQQDGTFWDGMIDGTDASRAEILAFLGGADFTPEPVWDERTPIEG